MRGAHASPFNSSNSSERKGVALTIKLVIGLLLCSSNDGPADRIEAPAAVRKAYMVRRRSSTKEWSHVLPASFPLLCYSS
jgi:hypothetical protein